MNGLVFHDLFFGLGGRLSVATWKGENGQTGLEIFQSRLFPNEASYPRSSLGVKDMEFLIQPLRLEKGRRVALSGRLDQIRN